MEHPANHDYAAYQRERLRMERRPHRTKRAVHILRRLLQGQDELSAQLPAPAARYVTARLQRRERANMLVDFKFVRPLYHPNIYPDGRLCISILHPPGDDEMSGETAAERWSPVQRVETVLISILSLLDDAEVSSPANVDAGVMLRNAPALYKEMVKKDLELSKQDIPADFVMPTHETAWRKEKDEGDFDMSWEDSDAESLDFGGSESEDEGIEVDSDFEGEDDDGEDEDMEEEVAQEKR
jgi:ubiquitin-conjugating enzyme E2 R